MSWADERLANPADDLLVTRRKDGALVVAAWNLVDLDKPAQGAPITVRLLFKGVPSDDEVAIRRVDEAHGNPMPAYHAHGQSALSHTNPGCCAQPSRQRCRHPSVAG